MSQVDMQVGSRSEIEARLTIFDKFSKSINYGTLSNEEKQAFAAARKIVSEVVVDAADLTLGSLPASSYVSVINPSGRTTNHYWSCLYPADVPHKSYALQVALIVSTKGMELCCCLGGGTTEGKDEVERASFEAELRFLRHRLQSVPAETKERLSSALGSRWAFRTKWRLDPAPSDFASLDNWLQYASRPEAAGASISRYWTRDTLPGSIDGLKALFREAVVLFGPLFDAIYLNRTAVEATVPEPPPGNEATATAASSTKAWIFQAIPTVYDLPSALGQLREIAWSVLQNKDQIHIGDRVFLWESGPKAGVLALARVSSEPALRADSEEELPFFKDPSDFGGERLSVQLKIEHVLPNRISRDEIRRHPELANLSILKFAQGTNFKVRPDEAAVLEELAAAGEKPAPASFDQLFGLFVNQFLAQPQGRAHLAAYDSARQQGRQNYQQIVAAKARSEDITDQVLQKLLPHANTAPNRERGAWVHLASAVNKEVKSWFEESGWTEAEDWPKVSTAILQLLEQSADHPDQLQEACAHFASLDYSTGLQSGMLSPILNALQPDAFEVLNSKSLKALNYFTGSRYSSKLQDYPEANAALRALLTKLSPVMHQFEVPPARDGDLFDMFCHWLVGIYRFDFPKSVPSVVAAVTAVRMKLNPEYSLAAMSDETGHDAQVLERWVRAILRKGQAILYGPPGTGKTYLAERLARHLIGGGVGATDLVQFHPAYSYEDFVQGIRPQSSSGGALSYPVLPGRFLSFCKDATERKSTSVLIIDEINRANLARVFGELMYLLEYRDRAIPLAGGGTFQIPPNVLLIGTMNTADRSIALVDHALRRRFAFLALYPDYELLRRFHAANGYDAGALIDTLKQLNGRIADKHYEVGISFFLRKDLVDHLEDIWRMEIEPYVQEYFFDDQAKADSFNWEKIKGAIQP